METLESAFAWLDLFDKQHHLSRNSILGLGVSHAPTFTISTQSSSKGIENRRERNYHQHNFQQQAAKGTLNLCWTGREDKLTSVRT
ncbi:hypothetical protein M0804_010677 [Polistes exclamans]|nr:hypothetical protein M0804_010677 [Polistes exclamans]